MDSDRDIQTLLSSPDEVEQTGAQVREMRPEDTMESRPVEVEIPGSQRGTCGLARVRCTPAGPPVPAQGDITGIEHEDNLRQDQ